MAFHFTILILRYNCALAISGTNKTIIKQIETFLFIDFSNFNLNRINKQSNQVFIFDKILK